MLLKVYVVGGEFCKLSQFIYSTSLLGLKANLAIAYLVKLHLSPFMGNSVIASFSRTIGERVRFCRRSCCIESVFRAVNFFYCEILLLF